MQLNEMLHAWRPSQNAGVTTALHEMLRHGQVVAAETRTVAKRRCTGATATAGLHWPVANRIARAALTARGSLD